MKISRRQFVADAAVAAGGWRLFGLTRPMGEDAKTVRRDGCVVLDLGEACALHESQEGYVAALGGRNMCPLNEARWWRRACRVAIVPGVGALDERTGEVLAELLETGTAVLLESAGGFCNHTEFIAHRRILSRFFDVHVDAPVDVWSEGVTVRYVHYDWPIQATVRDFSRVAPVIDSDAEVIGQIGELRIATKKRVGKGQLIFLGSPLGPALWAGDLEAGEWLRALLENSYWLV